MVVWCYKVNEGPFRVNFYLHIGVYFRISGFIVHDVKKREIRNILSRYIKFESIEVFMPINT